MVILAEATKCSKVKFAESQRDRTGPAQDFHRQLVDTFVHWIVPGQQGLQEDQGACRESMERARADISGRLPLVAWRNTTS
jgi:hypothetical protein